MLAREKRARNVTLIASSRFIALFSPLERKENKKKKRETKKSRITIGTTGANEWTIRFLFSLPYPFPGTRISEPTIRASHALAGILSYGGIRSDR